MILTILQARVSSSRLPGKVLMPLCGKAMLSRQIERIRRSTSIQRLLVATSDDESDDAIEAICRAEGVECFRGSLNDVLDRFYQAALVMRPTHVVRLTGDCPLTDPALIDSLVEYYLKGACDYASNALEPTYPDGLDAEIFRFVCLAEAWREAKLPSQREHVTPFIYQQPERYKIGALRGSIDLSHMRWTVDEPADFEFISRIYDELYVLNPSFTTEDILHLLERRPDLMKLNTGIRRNEGYLKSIDGDALNVLEDKD